MLLTGHIRAPAGRLEYAARSGTWSRNFRVLYARKITVIMLRNYRIEFRGRAEWPFPAPAVARGSRLYAETRWASASVRAPTGPISPWIRPRRCAVRPGGPRPAPRSRPAG